DMAPLAIAPPGTVGERLARNTVVYALRVGLGVGVAVIGRHIGELVADDEVGQVISLRHLREVNGEGRIVVEPTLLQSTYCPRAAVGKVDRLGGREAYPASPHELAGLVGRRSTLAQRVLLQHDQLQ